MTSPPSTDSQPMLWSGDSPAKTSVLQARAPDLVAPDPVSGGKCTVSSTKRARSGASSKTSQPFALEDWTRCCDRSMRSGSMRSGTVYPQPPLALATGATGAGLWPTPTAMPAPALKGLHGFNGQYWLKPDGRKHQTDLRLSVIGRSMFPTPSATDWEGAYKPGQRRGQLGDPAKQVVPAGGQLNPTWVEWLMGFPLGHTDCGPWATPSSRRSRKSSRRH